MSRIAKVGLMAGLLALSFIGARPGAAQTPPGAPGSGIITGGATVQIGDASAALRFLVGLDSPTPAQIAAADLDFNGKLDLGDVRMLLFAVVGLGQIPARPSAPKTTMMFATHTGWYDGSPVMYINTDSSDAALATQMNINFAPHLAKAKGTDAVDPLYVFFTEANGVQTPLAGQLPVFGSVVGADDYTPLWDIKHVIVSSSYVANTYKVDDDIEEDKGPTNGGFVTRIDDTGAILDCPMLFAAQTGEGIPVPYVTPSAVFSADSTMVTLPTEETLYDGEIFYMAAPDTSDAQDSLDHHVNLAPPLNSAGDAAIPFYVILNPDGKSTQPPVLSGAPEPLGPTSTSDDYSPIWHLTLVQWAGTVTNPPMLMSDDDVKTHLTAGDLKPLPGGFNFNCPIVGKEEATPPPPSNVTIQNFAFSPKDLSIAVGTTVTWTNQDSASHTATSGTPNNPDGMWNSGTLGTGKSFSFTFTKAGTFSYYCKFHPNMLATITVK